MISSTKYRGQELWIPKQFQDEFLHRLVGADCKCPFKRQVDLWWFAFCLGASIGARTPLPSDRHRRVKFNEGSILQTNSWQIPQLELWYLTTLERNSSAKFDPNTVLELDPSQILRIANEYANTGFAAIKEEIRNSTDPQLIFLKKLREPVS